MLIASLAIMGWSHEYYVSIFTINHNSEENRLEASVKVFRDDLETVLGSQSYEPIFMENEESKDLIDQLLADYLSRAIEIQDKDGNDKPIEYLGFENEKDVTFIYFQVSDFMDCQRMKLKNKWFLETFSDQVNIVHFTNGEQKKSEYFTQFETQKTYDFRKN